MSADRVAKGYDRLARSYDSLARLVYGNALRRAQTCMLPLFPPAATVMVLGGGSGWMLEQLLLQAQPGRVIYVELSGEMLAQAQRRIEERLPEALPKIAFVQGRAEDAVNQGKVDVIITHCLLDMFPDAALREMIGALKTCLKADGAWYFSDFTKVPRGPMSLISRILIWCMYRFFRWTCGIAAHDLPDFAAAFAHNGFSPQAERHFYGGMIVARMYAPSAGATI